MGVHRQILFNPMPTLLHMPFSPFVVSHSRLSVLSRHPSQSRSVSAHWTTRHCTAQHGTARHSTAQHGTARHGTVQHGTARHHKTPSPMLPLIPSNHPVNSPSSLTRVQQQSTPKSKDPDAKREARNITVSDTAHLHRRGDRTENLSSETARLHTMTNEMLRPHRVVSGMGHLHRMTSETAHFHRMVSEMVRLHKKGKETVPFHSTVSEMVHLYRMTSETA